MTKNKRLSVQEQDQTGVDAAVARGQNQVPDDKFEEFKTTMSRLYQATQQIGGGTAGSAPTAAAGQTQPPRQTGAPSATGTPGQTQRGGSQPQGRQTPLEQQIQQSISQPANVQGFVEIKRDASDAALTHIARQLGVEEDRLKKLAIDADVRLLINPDLLRVQ